MPRHAPQDAPRGRTKAMDAQSTRVTGRGLVLSTYLPETPNAKNLNYRLVPSQRIARGDTSGSEHSQDFEVLVSRI
jgi:hypothetical protein